MTAKLEGIQKKIAKLKELERKAKQPLVREKAKERQQKFLTNAAEQGKKRVGFFLSESAVAEIDRIKKRDGLKSANDVIEQLLSESAKNQG